MRITDEDYVSAALLDIKKLLKDEDFQAAVSHAYWGKIDDIRRLLESGLSDEEENTDRPY